MRTNQHIAPAADTASAIRRVTEVPAWMDAVVLAVACLCQGAAAMYVDGTCATIPHQHTASAHRTLSEYSRHSAGTSRTGKLL